ncbi:MAG: divalent-cation tolerance protein CutA [Planctomycetota bacterium]
MFVTVGSMENAEAIARTLIEDHLAACVNILPKIRSFYRWEGKVVDDEELLLVIKTRAPLFKDLKKRILELHAYELPEVISLDISMGNDPYLEWIASETET